MRSNQSQYITLWLNMTYQHIPRHIRKSDKFHMKMSFISNLTFQFKHPHNHRFLKKIHNMSTIMKTSNNKTINRIQLIFSIRHRSFIDHNISLIRNLALNRTNDTGCFHRIGIHMPIITE